MPGSGRRSPFQRIRDAWIGGALIVFNTLLALGAIEIASRVVLAVRDAVHPPVAEEESVDAATLALAYPGRTPEQIEDARASAVLTQVYAPWVQFRGPDRETAQVNASGFVRRSVPSVSRSAAEDEYFDVFFFGGSTMQGTRVGDDETIPAHFARHAADAAGDAVRVHNYGQPYYYSLQEAMLFAHLLVRGERPEAAVFLDGLNDVLQPGSTFYRQPFWTPKLEVLFDEDPPSASGAQSALGLWHSSGLYRLLGGAGVVPEKRPFESSYTPPPDLEESELIRTILDNYSDTQSAIRQLCDAFEVRCFFFWQPVPHYRYPNRSEDPFALQEPSTRFEAAYALMAERAGSRGTPVFLAGMLEDETGYPFVDAIHYSSPFGKRIAERMAGVVLQPWP
ncbi:MAG: SGNH/GDSL hydrolase family protein [bacterium]|nr:SGNH/GDSL hydrolase family protein [bacterium]